MKTPRLLASFGKAAKASLADLAGRIAGVVAIDNGISFTLDGEEYSGTLRGRNRDLVVGFNKQADVAIAVRVLLDGDAKLVGKKIK